MTSARRFLFPALLLALGWPALHADEKQGKKGEKIPEQVSYYKHVRPIFQQHCQGCHQPAKAEGGYVMTSYADLFKKGDKDEPGVVAGKPDKSYVVSQISPHDGKPAAMPRGKDPLTDFQVTLVKKWIAQGAKDDSPMSAREVVDMEHPPVYHLPPVVSALAYSPDGQLLAVSGHHEVLVHKADGTGLVARLVGLSERIQAVAFSPDGKLLAVSGGSPGRFGEVQIWDMARKRLKLSLPITYDTVYGVSWSSDGMKVAFGCADNSVRAIDLTGKQILFQGGHNDWVFGTCFSRENDYIVSVSRDMSMKLTEVATQRLIDNITSITPGVLKGGLAAVARRPLKDKKMSKVPPDVKGGKPHVYDEVVCGGSDGTPRLYKIHRETKRRIGDDDNKLKVVYAPMPGRVYAVAFNPDGTKFVAGSSMDGTGEVRVYQTDDGKFVPCAGQKGGVFAVAFRPDGRQVASAGFDGAVRLNDAQTGALVREFVPCPLAGQSAARAGAK